METESMEPHRASSSSNESRKSTSLRKDCYRKLLHVIEEIRGLFLIILPCLLNKRYPYFQRKVRMLVFKL